VKVVLRIVLQWGIKNVLHYAATALIFVRYALDLKREDLNMHKSYTHYVPKFAKLVQLSAQNMPPIMILVKNVPKLVKNAQQSATNWQQQKYKDTFL
jgi:hypothetical protein